MIISDKRVEGHSRRLKNNHVSYCFPIELVLRSY